MKFKKCEDCNKWIKKGKYDLCYDCFQDEIDEKEREREKEKNKLRNAGKKLLFNIT
tara:strand:+ start:88 stop:255 length:168 start_codon:yes stop_codon:yes gene_type:complete